MGAKARKRGTEDGRADGLKNNGHRRPPVSFHRSNFHEIMMNLTLQKSMSFLGVIDAGSRVAVIFSSLDFCAFFGRVYLELNIKSARRHFSLWGKMAPFLFLKSVRRWDTTEERAARPPFYIRPTGERN